jgi:hypothetical protein
MAEAAAVSVAAEPLSHAVTIDEYDAQAVLTALDCDEHTLEPAEFAHACPVAAEHDEHASFTQYSTSSYAAAHAAAPLPAFARTQAPTLCRIPCSVPSGMSSRGATVPVDETRHSPQAFAVAFELIQVSQAVVPGEPHAVMKAPMSVPRQTFCASVGAVYVRTPLLLPDDEPELLLPLLLPELLLLLELLVPEDEPELPPPLLLPELLELLEPSPPGEFDDEHANDASAVTERPSEKTTMCFTGELLVGRCRAHLTRVHAGVSAFLRSHATSPPRRPGGARAREREPSPRHRGPSRRRPLRSRRRCGPSPSLAA